MVPRNTVNATTATPAAATAVYAYHDNKTKRVLVLFYRSHARRQQGCCEISAAHGIPAGSPLRPSPPAAPVVTTSSSQHYPWRQPHHVLFLFQFGGSRAAAVLLEGTRARNEKVRRRELCTTLLPTAAAELLPVPGQVYDKHEAISQTGPSHDHLRRSCLRNVEAEIIDDDSGRLAWEQGRFFVHLTSVK